MTDDFPTDMADSIVAHMNEDHADAVLAIAQVHGNEPDATSASMVAITPQQLAIVAECHGRTRQTTIQFDPPVAPLDTVRARLISMTRTARAALASGDTG